MVLSSNAATAGFGRSQWNRRPSPTLVHTPSLSHPSISGIAYFLLIPKISRISPAE